MAEPDRSYFFVGELHAMTMRHDPGRQRRLSDETAMLLSALEPLQARCAELAADPAEVTRALRLGADRAAAAAAPRLAAASRAVGLTA